MAMNENVPRCFIELIELVLNIECLELLLNFDVNVYSYFFYYNVLNKHGHPTLTLCPIGQILITLVSF